MSPQQLTKQVLLGRLTPLIHVPAVLLVLTPLIFNYLGAHTNPVMLVRHLLDISCQSRVQP